MQRSRKECVHARIHNKTVVIRSPHRGDRTYGNIARTQSSGVAIEPTLVAGYVPAPGYVPGPWICLRLSELAAGSRH